MTTNDKEKSSQMPFVVFSDDWGIHPSSSQHIFKHILPDHRVAWINTIGMRRPSLTYSDFRKAARKSLNMFRMSAAGPTDPAEGNLRVYQPFMLPFSNISMVRKINRFFVKKTLDKINLSLNGISPVIVATVPNACDFVDLIPRQRIVYYCVDDFCEWPGMDKSLVMQMEKELVEKADAFLATSPLLVDRLSESGKPTTLLTHGVDRKLFSTEATEQHDLLRNIPSPRIGYFGLFDARSDQDLIAEVAKRMPEISIVITGKVEVPVDRLTSLENVYFVGEVPYLDLPKIVKGLDVLFIPYIVDVLTDALSPLKLKEYIATGKPVISTPIAAAAEFNDVIRIATDANAWCGEIHGCLATGLQLDQNVLEEVLARESWKKKAEQLLSHCLN